MGSKTSLTIQHDTLERFNAMKDELDAAQTDMPDHNADSFLNALLDTWEAQHDGLYETNTEEIIHALRSELDESLADAIRNQSGTDAPDYGQIQNALSEIERRVGNIERTLEDIQR